MSYARERFRCALETSYIGYGNLEELWTESPRSAASNKQHLTVTDNSIDDNSVKSALYVNLASSFDITSNVAIFGTLNNAFDKDPAIAPGGNGYPTNPVYFDTYGRTYKVGLRVKY